MPVRSPTPRSTARSPHWFDELPDRLAHRFPVTATPTSASSAPATPGCGRPTTSSGPTRRCASSCWRRGSPASGHPGATAAGCRGWSPVTATRWPSSTAATAWWPGSARSTTPSTRWSRWPNAEGIDAGIVKGGTLEIARNPAQAARLAAAIDEEREWGSRRHRAADEQPKRRQRIRFDGVRVRLPHPALRADPAGHSGARAGRRRRATRRADLRADRPSPRIEPGPRDDRDGHRHRADRAARHRGLHRRRCLACVGAGCR